MNNSTPSLTRENESLTRKLEQLRIEFTDLFTSHQQMVDQEAVILTSLYLEKLGWLQLKLLRRQTEASRLQLKMKMIQAALNRNEKPDLVAIGKEINRLLKEYYDEIESRSAALDQALKVLSNLLPEEETKKLREIYRILCKRLHPDLNPYQTEEEKELFIKVKAAYDLQKLADLQNILLYLDDSGKEKPAHIPVDEKLERIAFLEERIAGLKDKIAQLRETFPFNVKELIFNEELLSEKQENLRREVATVEEEIANYTKIIRIMTNE